MPTESRKIKRKDRPYPMNIAYELMGARLWKMYAYETSLSKEKKSEICRRLEEVIQEFPEKNQIAFNERWKKNLKWDNAADNLGITKDLVVYRAQRIMEKIREDEELKEHIFLYEDKEQRYNIIISDMIFLKIKSKDEESMKQKLHDYGWITVKDMISDINEWRQDGDAMWYKRVPELTYREKYIIELNMRYLKLLWMPDDEDEKIRLKNPIKYERIKSRPDDYVGRKHKKKNKKEKKEHGNSKCKKRK